MTPVCDKCHGDGKIETTTPNNTKFKTFTPCPDCVGLGHDTELIVCSRCGGHGYEFYSATTGGHGQCCGCGGHGQVRKHK